MRSIFRNSKFLQQLFGKFEPIKTWLILREFETWCCLLRSNENFIVKVSEIEAQLRASPGGATPDKIYREIVLKISEYSQSNFSNKLYIMLGGPLQKFSFDFSDFFSDESTKTQASISIHANNTELDISNGYFSEIIIGRNSQFLKKCWVKELHLVETKKVEILDCLVGNLIFGSAPVEGLLIKNSKIQCVTLDHPDKYRAISNYAEIINTRFEVSKTHSSLFKDAQSFRFLRMNFDRLENTILSNLMKTLEYRSDRHREPKLTRFINFLYDLCSEYGTNTTRPFLILIGTWVLTATWLDWMNEAILTNEISYYQGWMRILVDSEWWRSFYLTTQSSYNYISIFGQEQSIIAKSHWVRGILFFEGLFSVGLFLMIIFGLRKRFKLH